MAAAPAPNYRRIAVQAAQRYGVDPGVFTRQIQQESGFNPAARSGAGAVGIAQFMPATAQSYGIDPTNPVQSLNAAARYDANELKAFHGDYRPALAAYNSGAGNADKWNDPNFGGGQTYRYVRDILGGSTPPAPAAGGSSVSPLAAATTRTVPQPQVNESKLLAALSGANSNGGDYSQFYATLKNALQARQQPQPAAASGVPQALAATPTAAPQAKAGVVQAAKTMLGTPYVWGGNNPGKALDCSGFLQQAYAKIGVQIPRTTQTQFQHGQPVALNQLQSGDAVFTEPGKSGPNHVGMYVGNGMVQESPHTGDVNKYIPLKDFLGGGFVGARRYT